MSISINLNLDLSEIRNAIESKLNDASRVATRYNNLLAQLEDTASEYIGYKDEVETMCSDVESGIDQLIDALEKTKREVSSITDKMNCDELIETFDGISMDADADSIADVDESFDVTN